jgi:hypothetical protein
MHDHEFTMRMHDACTIGDWLQLLDLVRGERTIHMNRLVGYAQIRGWN